MAIFFNFFFQPMQDRKMSFTIFQNEKRTFQATKTRKSKSRKIHIFPKALTHGFGPKMATFPTLTFMKIQASKMSFTIFQNEKTPFQAINTRSSKSLKIDIFPKGLTHGSRSKNGHFSNFYFFKNTGQLKVFYDILEQKNAFLGYKKKNFNNLKN